MNDDAWDWGLRSWEAYFGLVLVSAVIYVLAEDDSLPAGAVAIVLLAVLVPWYVLVGRRVIGKERPGPLPYVYVAGMIALCGAAASAAPESSIVLFAACPQCFMLVRWWQSVVAVILLNGVPAARFLVHSTDVASMVSFAVWTVVAVGFSAYFGFWVDRIIQQSSERRDLISELKATQSELSEVSREAGVMAERERMAAEIHDTLAQGFTSILMLLQAAEPQVARDPDGARRQIGLAARTARENLSEARALVAAMPPSALGDSSLDEAVRRLADRLAEEMDLDTECTVSGEPRRLPARTEVVLLRSAQEGLANVRKHADAGHVAIGLHYDAPVVRLEMCDDGRGFDPDTAQGFGLRGMRERAGQVGGTLSVRSTPGEGTSIIVEVPAS
jgi:signal transduction histidine kinase